MTIKQRLYLSVAAIAVLFAAAPLQASAQTTVAIDNDDIGGVVSGPNGPEAGVWVIAETTELPTSFAKMVVTDDQGRYVIPDLPTANYSVWVRGYGLVDSPKRRAKPGQHLDLAAVPAPTPAAAAHYYPAIYWYTMMKIPPASDFGGSTDIPKNITRENWLRQMNNVDCVGCHQLGQESTRTIPAQLGQFKSGAEAWIRRIQSGQSGEMMTNRIAGQFGGVPFKYFGDWTDRVAKGELPKAKPPRPQGVERNLVVTSWEWSSAKHYLHDLIASDRRNPTVNSYGPLFGSPEYATDDMPILDPKTHKVTFFKMPVQDPQMPESARPRTCRGDQADAALALLGRREDLGYQGQQSQRHVRQEGPRVDRGHGARPRQSGVLQEGLRSPLGQGVSARAVVAAGGDARSQDDEIYIR